MNDNTATICGATLELPGFAPRIRITAGPGSAAQKTWNLRRPVTLIGSRRPAHIVLHDRDISHAHCVIINTGREVVLKDLHTRAGTTVNKERTDLTLLNDGDVIMVGDTTIQIAIQPGEDAADDSGCGATYDDPLTFPSPIRVGLIHGDRQWYLCECVGLVGRHIGAAVRLDHDDVASRHAIIFRFRNSPAIFDLGGREGVLLNGQHCSLAPLVDGDRVSIGSFGLQFKIDQPGSTAPEAAAVPMVLVPSVTPDAATAPIATNGSGKAHAEPTVSGAGAMGVPDESPKPDAIQRDIAEAWQQLNSWSTEPRESAAGATNSDAATDLAARLDALSKREAELDARDATLRGRLLDLERLTESHKEREQALDAKATAVEAERRRVAAAEQGHVQREADIARRIEELARREHVFAQRWSRMRAAQCPHCGQPIATTGSPSADAPAGS